jgi:hypothetical protein
MNEIRGIGFVLVLILSSGCDINDAGFMCNDEYVYGVRAEILCPALSDPAEWSGVVRLSSKGYEEELSVLPTPEDGRFVAFGAGERPGTYTLTVEHSGCKRWEQKDITVLENTCHVDQVKLTVELEQQ